MLPPYDVHLLAHDPAWSEQAEQEASRLLRAAYPSLASVEHIGSTSIPGILAKPIIDLMGIGPDLKAIENARPAVEGLGYAWHGEYGLEGRRYCTLTDTATGLRKFHLHCYAAGDHSLTIGEGVALTATREVLEAMGAEVGRPRRSLLALGYAGWGPGQLEKEIRENVWLTVAPDEALIFGGDHTLKWQMALAKLGIDPSLLSAEAGRA